MRVGILAAFLFAMLQSCSYKEEIKVQNINNEFTMAVPSYLKEDKTLKPGAPFQYCNRFRNIYAVVFSEDKSTVKQDFQTYYNTQVKIIKAVLKNPGVSDSTAIEIGGAKGVKTEIFGNMQDENIYYSHMLLETEEKYYQVCVWTRGEERKLKYGPAIEALLYSFNLINKES